MKTKTKIYQLFKNSSGDPIVVCIGTAVYNSRMNDKVFTKDIIWDLFNWTRWSCRIENKNKAWLSGIRNGVRRKGVRIFPNHYSLGWVASNIFFRVGDKWHVAESFGCGKASSFDEALEKCIENNKFYFSSFKMFLRKYQKNS